MLLATLALREIMDRVESRQRHNGDLRPASLPADWRVRSEAAAGKRRRRSLTAQPTLQTTVRPG